MAGYGGFYREAFGFELTLKNVGALAFLVVLPNILGMFTYTTVYGINIHFFQYAIFLAAFTFGPYGGALGGLFGSAYVALKLGNPYVVVGNMVLGYAAGYLARRGWNPFRAAMTAYMIQLPWLVLTDIYLVGMSATAVSGVVVSLAASNMALAIFAGKSRQELKKWI